MARSKEAIETLIHHPAIVDTFESIPTDQESFIEHTGHKLVQHEHIANHLLHVDDLDPYNGFVFAGGNANECVLDGFEELIRRFQSRVLDAEIHLSFGGPVFYYGGETSDHPGIPRDYEFSLLEQFGYPDSMGADIDKHWWRYHNKNGAIIQFVVWKQFGPFMQYLDDKAPAAKHSPSAAMMVPGSRAAKLFDRMDNPRWGRLPGFIRRRVKAFAKNLLAAWDERDRFREVAYAVWGALWDTDLQDVHKLESMTLEDFLRRIPRLARLWNQFQETHPVVVHQGHWVDLSESQQAFEELQEGYRWMVVAIIRGLTGIFQQNPFADLTRLSLRLVWRILVRPHTQWNRLDKTALMSTEDLDPTLAGTLQDKERALELYQRSMDLLQRSMHAGHVTVRAAALAYEAQEKARSPRARRRTAGLFVALNALTEDKTALPLGRLTALQAVLKALAQDPKAHEKLLALASDLPGLKNIFPNWRHDSQDLRYLLETKALILDAVGQRLAHELGREPEAFQLFERAFLVSSRKLAGGRLAAFPDQPLEASVLEKLKNDEQNPLGPYEAMSYTIVTLGEMVAGDPLLANIAFRLADQIPYPKDRNRALFHIAETLLEQRQSESALQGLTAYFHPDTAPEPDWIAVLLGRFLNYPAMAPWIAESALRLPPASLSRGDECYAVASLAIGLAKTPDTHSAAQQLLNRMWPSANERISLERTLYRQVAVARVLRETDLELPERDSLAVSKLALAEAEKALLPHTPKQPAFNDFDAFLAVMADVIQEMAYSLPPEQLAGEIDAFLKRTNPTLYDRSLRPYFEALAAAYSFEGMAYRGEVLDVDAKSIEQIGGDANPHLPPLRPAYEAAAFRMAMQGRTDAAQRLVLQLFKDYPQDGQLEFINKLRDAGAPSEIMIQWFRLLADTRAGHWDNRHLKQLMRLSAAYPESAQSILSLLEDLIQKLSEKTDVKVWDLEKTYTIMEWTRRFVETWDAPAGPDQEGGSSGSSVVGRAMGGLFSWIYGFGNRKFGWTEPEIERRKAPIVEGIGFQFLFVQVPILATVALTTLWPAAGGMDWNFVLLAPPVVGLVSALMSALYFASPLIHPKVIEYETDQGHGPPQRTEGDWTWGKAWKLFQRGLIYNLIAFVFVEAALSIGGVLTEGTGWSPYAIAWALSRMWVLGTLSGLWVAISWHGLDNEISQLFGDIVGTARDSKGPQDTAAQADRRDQEAA